MRPVGCINKMEKTKKMMVWGSVFVIVGWVLVFLMTTKLIATSYILSLLSYGIFLTGFTMGMIAAFSHARMERNLREHKSFQENQWEPNHNKET